MQKIDTSLRKTGNSSKHTNMHRLYFQSSTFNTIQFNNTIKYLWILLNISLHINLHVYEKVHSLFLTLNPCFRIRPQQVKLSNDLKTTDVFWLTMFSKNIHNDVLRTQLLGFLPKVYIHITFSLPNYHKFSEFARINCISVVLVEDLKQIYFIKTFFLIK